MMRNIVNRKTAGTVQPELPPDNADDATVADYLGTVHSHPTWLVARWLAAFGRKDTEELLRANNKCAAPKQGG